MTTTTGPTTGKKTQRERGWEKVNTWQKVLELPDPRGFHRRKRTLPETNMTTETFAVKAHKEGSSLKRLDHHSWELRKFWLISCLHLALFPKSVRVVFVVHESFRRFEDVLFFYSTCTCVCILNSTKSISHTCKYMFLI